MIRFENQKSAAVPAQEVFVSHPLDSDLDLDTLELGAFGFGDLVVNIPPGLQNFETRVQYQNLDGSPLLIDVSIQLNVADRQLQWTMRSVDPNTGLLPEGLFDGFLPPNLTPPIGEGYVTYRVSVLAPLRRERGLIRRLRSCLIRTSRSLRHPRSIRWTPPLRRVKSQCLRIRRPLGSH